MVELLSAADCAVAHTEEAGPVTAGGRDAQEPEDSCVVLQDASHQLVMITGDTPLTACHAAKQVHIVDRPVLILDYHRSAPFGAYPYPMLVMAICIT